MSMKLARLGVIGVVAASLIGMLAIGHAPIPPAAAVATVSQTFTPVADAYVSSAKPSSNYGTSPKLKADASPVVTTYLRFDVTGIPGDVVQATLRLHPPTRSARR